MHACYNFLYFFLGVLTQTIYYFWVKPTTLESKYGRYGLNCGQFGVTYKCGSLIRNPRCGMVYKVDNSSSGQFYSIPRKVINEP